MTDVAYAAERDADRRAERRALVIILTILAGVFVVNSLTTVRDYTRLGSSINALEPWIWEGSSVVVMMALLPAMLWLTRRVPLALDAWRVWLPVYAAGSVVYSLVHITAMVVLRKLAYLPLFGRTYEFSDNLLAEFVYEYRKDLLAYAIIVFVIAASRHFEQLRREASAAREDAERSRRITLKCGGRVMRVEASEIAWARAAANYVEVKAGERTLLARATLSAIADQLAEAGVRAVRVHRSFLVNPDHIAEIAPTGEGDVRITMRDGEVIPGSRRYRDRLPAA